ncbi:hypothetical protein AB4Y42_06095 [Paraburkholderia sp. EG286B]|uniref:hypothetical protein n=1 Tax=Paraburkholderia sp. EG286B TaxID=3237011 RepID=UPI0034D2CE3D
MTKSRTLPKRPRKSSGLIAWEEQRDALTRVTADLSAALMIPKPAERKQWLDSAFTAADLFPSDDLAERIAKIGNAKRVSVEKLAALRDECAQALALVDSKLVPMLYEHIKLVEAYRAAKGA